jgi:hypothetical protein
MNMNMNMSNCILRLTALALAGAIVACSPSKEDVADAARGALVQMFATTPETKDLGLTVGRVTLVTVEPNKVYDGVALVSKGKESRDIPIHVITDGEQVLVTPDPNVLGLLVVSEADAAMEREMEHAISEMEAASAALDSAMTEPTSSSDSDRVVATPAPDSAEDFSLSGRFVSNSGNAILILPRREGGSPAVLQLGVGTNPHCVEGDVSCVSLDGKILQQANSAKWISEGPSRCEVSLRFTRDSADLLPLTVPCDGFGTANAHLGASIAGTYSLDRSAEYSPSFECAKATTAVEEIICATPVLGFLDHALGAAYKQHQSGSTDRPASRREQLEWVASRDVCKDDACIMQTYLDRLYRLQ